ncbi:unnamed protein product [Nesidiocoris tenuis]|uniref:Neuroglian n=1 Tax=Nesidiocoris tenuis TaxID=355587 RepID=A0A6H5HLE9_9HEMI|nr:unnamed protein product [Nesidiocoris tenuis]
MLLFKSNDPDHIEHVCSGENRSSQTFNQSPPRIVKQPPSDELLFQVYTRLETINEKPFVIECEAEGEPAPKYQWVKNGKRFNWQAYDDRISQQPGRGTLVISSPRDEDLGQYQCFASNEWGTATSNSVFVRKAELNAFKDQSPLSVQAQEGEPFKLTCNPPDGWPKPNVYWLIQRSDGGIESINNSRMTVDPEGNLWFSNVTKRDATNDFAYACAATSLFRSEYKIGNRVLLNVVASGVSASQNRHPPVKQYVTRKNEVAIRGSKVQLFCIYGGTPLPHTVWSYNGKPLQLSERVSQEHFGKSLLLKHVEFSDKGTYTCEVSNGQGQVQSYSITLNVLAAPYFTVEPEIVNAAEDETAELVCEASGDPEPQIKWIHNGLPISEAPLNPRRKVTPNKIVIEKLTKKDTGNYGCNATNSIGYVYKDVYINVLAVPPEIIEPPTNKEVVDGKTVIMTCRVFGAPKPEVKWVRNRVELTGGRYTILPQGDLEIKEINFLDAGVYDCHAANKLGSQSRSATLQVKGKFRVFSYQFGQSFVIKVVALNEKGESNVAAKEVYGYSGEDVPTESPTNFTLVQVLSSTGASLRWNPVSQESVRGHFEGYKIQTWTDKDTEGKMREIIINGRSTFVSAEDKFIPNSKNFARVLVFNSRYNGPPSETINFDTPEGVPGTVQSLEAVPLGSSGLLLMWKKPEQTNGILTGYKIYYQTVKGTKVGPLLERQPSVTDPKQTRVKLAGLEPATKYRIHIKATTAAGEGEGYFIEHRTRGSVSVRPDPPSFHLVHLDSDNGYAQVKVVWLPYTEGKPGSHFFVKYRVKGEPTFMQTLETMDTDYVIVKGLEPSQVYEFQVASVDGEFVTESAPQEVQMYSVGKGSLQFNCVEEYSPPSYRSDNSSIFPDGPTIDRVESVATAGWFIGMLLAIVFLLLVLILVCIIKRNRGGKYAVHEREAAHGRHDYPEDAGFHEYSQPLDSKSHGRSSLGSDPKAAAESDTDSMAEYGEGDTGRFTEDGSFIGQYGPGNEKKKVEEQPTLSSVATYV